VAKTMDQATFYSYLDRFMDFARRETLFVAASLAVFVCLVLMAYYLIRSLRRLTSSGKRTKSGKFLDILSSMFLVLFGISLWITILVSRKSVS